jgi:AcrR family transcriptional regulator
VNASRGARERAREEITAEIKEAARRRLADEGAARLSLRAVARELGMVSSAVYRYFPSRDDLLTALIVDAYDALGARAETAQAQARHEDHLGCWLAVCRAVRGWALAHPHEYALLYGTPVPGYAAPQETTAPASRVGLALARVLAHAHAAGALTPPAEGPAVPPAVLGDAAELADRLGVPLPAWAVTALVAAWAELFGLVGFELFGQFHQVVGPRPEFFDHAAAVLAHNAGLRPRLLPAE